jgi:hypothetical protein
MQKKNPSLKHLLAKGIASGVDAWDVQPCSAIHMHLTPSSYACTSKYDRCVSNWSSVHCTHLYCIREGVCVPSTKAGSLRAPCIHEMMMSACKQEMMNYRITGFGLAAMHASSRILSRSTYNNLSNTCTTTTGWMQALAAAPNTVLGQDAS